AYVRIRGLPPAVALTEGHAIAPGVWAVPLSALSGLAAIVPIGAQGGAEITIDLVSLDGNVLAQAKTTMRITAAQPAPAARVAARECGGGCRPRAGKDQPRRRAGVRLLPKGPGLDGARQYRCRPPVLRTGRRHGAVAGGVGAGRHL